MISARLTHPEFHDGDEVVLAEGTYRGTLGVFLHLREDLKWADIVERNATYPQPSGCVARSCHGSDASPLELI